MRHDVHRHRVPATAAALFGAIVLLSATLTLAAAAAAEREADNTTSATAGALALGTITSFSPASVTAGSGSFTLLMTLSPSASSEPTWTAQWSGPSGVFPLAVGSAETTSVSVAVPATAVSRAGSVIVSLSDGATAWSGGYSVTETATAPHVDATSPQSAAAGGAAFTLRVNGSDFATGATPAYVTWNGTRLAEAAPTGPVNPTAILYAAVPASAVLTPGVATVKVVNPLLGGGLESNGVTFAVQGPSLTGIAPATGANSTTALSFVVNGVDLALAGAPRVVQLRGTGSNTSTVITATGVAYEPPFIPGGQGRIVGVFNLADTTGASVPVPAPPGRYDLHMTFTNGGPKSVTLAQAFEVTGPALSSVAPTSTTNGVSSLALTLTGTGLNTLVSPSVTLKGPGSTGTTVVTATGVIANVSGTTVTCKLDLTSPTVAPAGLYDVTIRYAGSKTLTRPQALSVVNGIPAVTSVSPDVTWAGSVKPTTLTVAGTGFVPPAAASVTGSRVRIGARPATTTTFVSATRLTVPLTAADVAAPGVLPVTVENPTPGGGTSSSGWLTVGSDTSAPTTTLAGADTLWHNKPVTLTIATVDTQSGVQRTQWTQNGGTAVTLSGSTITVPAPAGGAGDGYQRIAAWSTDWCNHVENHPASVTVRIDTVGPKTYAWAPSSVKRKASVKLKFRADDLTPTSVVTLKIKKANGTVARAYAMGPRTSYEQYTYTVKPRLAKGAYKLYVYAKDQAGNRQTRLGTDTFRVK